MVTATVKRCGNCRYWSELIARAAPIASGVVEALCLREIGESPYARTYTSENRICLAWKGGEPIDAMRSSR